MSGDPIGVSKMSMRLIHHIGISFSKSIRPQIGIQPGLTYLLPLWRFALRQHMFALDGFDHVLIEGEKLSDDQNLHLLRAQRIGWAMRIHWAVPQSLGSLQISEQTAFFNDVIRRSLDLSITTPDQQQILETVDALIRACGVEYRIPIASKDLKSYAVEVYAFLKGDGARATAFCSIIDKKSGQMLNVSLGDCISIYELPRLTDRISINNKSLTFTPHKKFHTLMIPSLPVYTFLMQDIKAFAAGGPDCFQPLHDVLMHPDKEPW